MPTARVVGGEAGGAGNCVPSEPALHQEALDTGSLRGFYMSVDCVSRGKAPGAAGAVLGV